MTLDGGRCRTMPAFIVHFLFHDVTSRAGTRTIRVRDGGGRRTPAALALRQGLKPPGAMMIANRKRSKRSPASRMESFGLPAPIEKSRWNTIPHPLVGDRILRSAAHDRRRSLLHPTETVWPARRMTAARGTPAKGRDRGIDRSAPIPAIPQGPRRAHLRSGRSRAP
jgi:hypothetical protein